MDIRLQRPSETTYSLNKRLAVIYYRDSGVVRTSGILTEFGLMRDGRYIEWLNDSEYIESPGPIVDRLGNYIPRNRRQYVNPETRGPIIDPNFDISQLINTAQDTTYKGLRRSLKFADKREHSMFAQKNYVPPGFLPPPPTQQHKFYLPKVRKGDLRKFLSHMFKYDKSDKGRYSLLDDKHQLFPRYYTHDDMSVLVNPPPSDDSDSDSDSALGATGGVPAITVSSSAVPVSGISVVPPPIPDSGSTILPAMNIRDTPPVIREVTQHDDEPVPVTFPYDIFRFKSFVEERLQDFDLSSEDIDLIVDYLAPIVEKATVEEFYDIFGCDTKMSTQEFVSHSKPDNDSHHAVCFKPREDINNESRCDFKLVCFLLTARNSISVQQDYVDGNLIILALCWASFRNNVSVRCVFSKQMLDYKIILATLILCNIEVVIDTTLREHNSSIFIVDDIALANGSYPAITAAESNNRAENLLFSYNEPFIQQYVRAFELAFNRSSNILDLYNLN